MSSRRSSGEGGRGKDGTERGRGGSGSRQAPNGTGKAPNGTGKAPNGTGKAPNGTGKAPNGGGRRNERQGRPRTKAAESSRPPASTKARGEREVSAGGVVVRGRDVVVIVPVRRAADGSQVLSLPKGHVDPGETPVQAATREVHEEAGVVAEPLCELGESRYWYRRDRRTVGKSVRFYLFRYVSGETADHDEEVEQARWISLTRAKRELTYPAEREMVERAIARLKEDDRKDR